MILKAVTTVLAAVFLASTVAFAAEDDTPLTKEMKVMNRNLRTLKKQVEDPAKKDENVALVETIKKSLAEAAKLEPAKTKDVPEAERAAYLEKYKQEMEALQKTYDDLEEAIKGGKTDDAQKAFAKLGEQKKKGHKDFAPEDEH